MAEKTVANILKKTNQLKDSHIIIQLFCKLVEMLKKTKRRESHYHLIKESFPMMYELLYKRPTIRNLEYDFNLLLISIRDTKLVSEFFDNYEIGPTNTLYYSKEELFTNLLKYNKGEDESTRYTLKDYIKYIYQGNKY